MAKRAEAPAVATAATAGIPEASTANLHIWPRGSFMLIALPNGDASWTVTLFAPARQLRRLHATPSDAPLFFREQGLHDALELLGEEQLKADFAATPPAMLLSVKSLLHPVDLLHVWPRGSFMLMALPNGDASWTVTLFAPSERLRSLCADPVMAVRLFQAHLADALELIGMAPLERDFAAGRPALLIGLKCNPYHVDGRAIIIGDAAHAMVPFYGQGMNAGFEDCLLLDHLMEKHKDDLPMALSEFSRIRNPDAEAICDLAMYNYTEMRELVAKKSYYFRKKLDVMLYRIVPNIWIPLYPSVAFTSNGYRWCLDNKNWQDKVLQICLVVFGLLLISTIVLMTWNLFSNENWQDL